MNKYKLFIVTVLSLLIFVCVFYLSRKQFNGDKYISYIVDVKTQNLKLYYCNDSNEKFRSIASLKKYVESKKQNLVFAMNGGMFKSDNTPVGLYIQDRKIIASIDNSDGDGNFYIKPNGVFYVTTDSQAMICRTPDFVNLGNIKYATQSGPMMVIDGAINPKLKQGSDNLNIRNGVGILPDNKVVFAMSKEPINFYDFAKYFKDLGCKKALYLDGFVSRTYLPEKNWIQTDGDFGVIIGVTKDK